MVAHSSPDEWATTKQACRDELVVLLVFFFNIYFALLLCIEHCFAKIKFHTSYIYIHLYPHVCHRSLRFISNEASLAKDEKHLRFVSFILSAFR